MEDYKLRKSAHIQRYGKSQGILAAESEEKRQGSSDRGQSSPAASRHTDQRSPSPVPVPETKEAPAGNATKEEILADKDQGDEAGGVVVEGDEDAVMY